jgi:hypothetical protein
MARYTYHNQMYDFQGRAIGPVGVFTNAATAKAVACVHVFMQPEVMQIRITRCLEHTYEFKPYMIVYMNIVTNKPMSSRREVF